MLKIDEKHPKFRGKVLCSAGIGAGYLKREDAKRHVYKKGETKESYRDWETKQDRKSTRLNSSHRSLSRMPSSA